MNEEPSREALWRIEQAILSDLTTVHPILRATHVTMIMVAIVLGVAAIGFERNGAFALAVMTPVQMAGMFAVIACSVVLAAHSIARQMIPGSRYRVLPDLVPLVIVIPLVTVVAVMFPFGTENHFWITNWSCIKLGMSLASAATALMWLVLRNGAILSPRVAGASAGLLAGLAGTAALEVHCPNLHVAHVLVSHVGVAVFSSVAGFLFGSLIEIVRVTFLFRWRTDR